MKLEADFLTTGVGSEKTSFSLKEKLSQNNYDFIIIFTDLTMLI